METSSYRYFGLTRVDDTKSRTHAWVVCLQRRRQIWRKYFSDGNYGGREAALREALIYRGKLAEDHPKMSMVEYASKLRKNNLSGTPGVCRVEKGIRATDGQVRAYWVARLPSAHGRDRLKSFSILIYGDEEAFCLAWNERRRALVALGDMTSDRTSCKPLEIRC